MNRFHTLPIVLTLVAFSTSASAQFVKGNEAVRTSNTGERLVELAPLPSSGPIRKTKPCLAQAGCHAGPWHMVETREGLVECTEVYAREGTCRPSSYGTTKLSRIWVLKTGGQWLQCRLPDLGSKCVKVFAPPPTNLPYPAVQ
ncbi:MAG: hypothetical protein Q8S96_08165 [Hydrogenophaga sp.]|jgi:hypothetical protein|uniref:hypothetical protein n=1 Tax=Hydrogenophaga sp. TaxID=1904254 RepID=UPI00271B373F|nr:hypothetical protein [Hydrogenophaga sp.]MDO9482403.1 hypothetical protein [Hydrogenophaga sp.]MDP3344416.1 hypothetical protein [Hydrogenophaga sp.]MDP3808810.1 hypothetical protein [Hydrogenophaga sp.]MDP3922447.1 hypothetical protein [Hydrogenophaga sp.]